MRLAEVSPFFDQVSLDSPGYSLRFSILFFCSRRSGGQTDSDDCAIWALGAGAVRVRTKTCRLSAVLRARPINKSVGRTRLIHSPTDNLGEPGENRRKALRTLGTSQVTVDVD